MSAVPLFASSRSSRTTTASPRRSTAVARGGRYILGPEVEAFEEEFAALPRRAPLRRRRQRHRRAHDRAAGARRRARRRGGPALVHVLRHRRGGARRWARGRCSATSTRTTFCVTARDRRGGAHAAHEGDRRRCTCSATSRPSPELRDARRAGDRGRRAGGRARRSAARKAGALGDAATFSFFPSKNLPVPRRRRRDRHRRRRAWPSARACCASTARRTSSTFTEVGCNSRLDELQAAVLRVLLPELDGWNDRAPRRRGGLRAAGPRRARAAAARRRTARGTPTTCTSCARERELPRIGARLLPHAGAPPAGDAALRRRRAARHRRGGAHQPRAADGHGPHRGRRCARSWRACASGST